MNTQSRAGWMYMCTREGDGWEKCNVQVAKEIYTHVGNV